MPKLENTSKTCPCTCIGVENTSFRSHSTTVGALSNFITSGNSTPMPRFTRGYRKGTSPVMKSRARCEERNRAMYLEYSLARMWAMKSNGRMNNKRMK